MLLKCISNKATFIFTLPYENNMFLSPVTTGSTHQCVVEDLELLIRSPLSEETFLQYIQADASELQENLEEMFPHYL